MLSLPMRAVAAEVRPGIGHPDPNVSLHGTEADMYASAALPPIAPLLPGAKRPSDSTSPPTSDWIIRTAQSSPVAASQVSLHRALGRAPLDRARMA